MKILFLTNTTDPTAGGWGRYTHDLKEALEMRGHVVKSVPEYTNTKKAETLRAWQHLINPFSLLVDAVRVRRALGEYKPDVVHITVETYALLLPFIAVPKSTRVILTVHGTYAYTPILSKRLIRPLYKIFFQHALRKVDAIIAVSTFTAKRLKKYLREHNVVFDAKNIHVIHNGIDTREHEKYKIVKGERDAKTILTVAPVKARKGIEEALHAIGAYVSKYDTTITYRIVGGHDAKSLYGKKIQLLIHTFGLKDVVSFVGRVSDEELDAEYKQADLFLMLPIIKGEHFEGFGLVYLEANARGVPTIGSREGGSAEAIKDGVSGFLVNAQNSAEVAERIHDVLNRQLINSRDARLWAEEHDITKVCDSVLSVYHNTY